MVFHCSVTGCRNHQVPYSNIKFHNYPLKKPELLAKWLKVLKRVNFQPSKSTKICNCHFTKEDYYSTGTKLFLRHDAVPSIFPSDSNYEKRVEEVKAGGLVTELNVVIVPTATTNPSSQDTTSDPLVIITQNQVFNNENTLNNKISNYTQTIDDSSSKVNLNRKIKILQHTVKKKDMKIREMNSLMLALKREQKRKDLTIKKLKHLVLFLKEYGRCDDDLDRILNEPDEVF